MRSEPHPANDARQRRSGPAYVVMARWEWTAAPVTLGPAGTHPNWRGRISFLAGLRANYSSTGDALVICYFALLVEALKSRLAALHACRGAGYFLLTQETGNAARHGGFAANHAAAVRAT
jgi:hypothetical protein